MNRRRENAAWRRSRVVAAAILSLMLLTALTIVAFAGCGGGDNTTTPADTGTLEAAATDAGDGEASPGPAPFPAFPLDFPIEHNFGGPTLVHPNIVAFVDPADDRAAAVTALLQSVGASDYWKSVTAEYGIEPFGTVTVSPYPTPLPASLTAAELQARVGALAYESYGGDGGVQADAATGPTAPNGFRTDTLYVVLIPFTTTVSDSPCTDVLGYHNSADATMYDSVPFAVVLPCTYKGYTNNQLATATMTHELVESVTDPFPYVAPAFLEVDDAHIAWAYQGYTELGDLCGDRFTTTIGGTPVYAETIWSNARASKGVFPCSPDIPGTAPPVFQALPQFKDTLRYSSSTKTKGIFVDLNATGFIDVHVTSLAPTGSLKLQAFDVANYIYHRPAELALSLDRTTAKNGDVVHLTIARDRIPPTGVEVYGSVFGIAATDPLSNRTYVTYGFVASKM